MQGSLNTEEAHAATSSMESAPYMGMFVGRWAGLRRQPIVILVLVFSDILLAIAIALAAFVLQAILGQAVFGRGQPTDIAITSMVANIITWVGLRTVIGLYPGYGLGPVEELRRQTLALLGTLTISMTFAFALQIGDSISRILLFAWALGLLVLAPLARHSVKWALMRASLWGKPVLILGSHKAGANILKVLQQQWQIGLTPVAVFDNLEAPAEGMVEGVPYGGTLSDAVALATKHKVDTAIVAMPHTRREHLAKFVKLVDNRFRHIVIIPNLEGVTNSEVVARDLGGTFAIEIKYNLLAPWAQRLKRMVDLVATFVGGVLILPLVLALAVLVWIESRGPIFYKDLRMGRDNKLFSCIKFRTMVPDAETLLQQILKDDTDLREEYRQYHKLRNDPRVTRVGRFLRKTSLDELPQLWNVLRGEMSLVGPRPYLPRESEKIGTTQDEILRVLPGITGPWQVSGRSHASFEERVAMDARYVRDWSVWLDFVLLARTVRCLLFSRDAY